MSTYPRDYFRINHLLYKIVGNYVPRSSEPFGTKLFYNIYNASILLMILAYIPFELRELPHSAKNITDLVEHMGIIFSHVLYFIKLFTWIAQHGKIHAIMDTLDSPVYRYEDYKDFKPGAQITKHKWMFLMFFRGFFTIGAFVPGSKIGEAVVKFYKKRDAIDGVSLRCQGILPYYVKFPFDMENARMCGLSFAIQMVPLFMITFQIITYDMLFLNICIYVRGHLIIIQGAFRTLRERCLNFLSLPEDYAEGNDDALNREMLKELRRITVHLQKIILLVEEMENAFTWVSLSQAIVTVMVMVSCLFVMSIEPLFSAAFTAQLDYCLGIYLQFAFYCIFGNEITLQSDLITTAIYESDWLSASKRFKTTMLINMTRMKKPLVLTVGKFTPLTLALLVQVLKGSYSYFTVLKQRA